jgi:hypothetical protein
VLLAEIRRGVAAVVDTVPGCRTYPTVPEGLAASGVTAVVVAHGEPYVTYTQATRGVSTQHEIRLRLVIIPPQASGAERILDEIDALLSCGVDADRSLRNALAADISADGTACAVSTVAARVRTITINDFAYVVGELELNATARG